MCGLAGIYNFNHQPVSTNTIIEMTRLLKHRGPDAEGHFVENSFGIGHRRLSIVDLSNSGTQPMSDQSGQFVIAYNGEIYNYIHLRKDLVCKGYQFKTNTDTEVLLNGFVEYGAKFVNKINGMFSFAIFNKRARTLFLFRDRLGIKPLYYYVDKDRIIFSSEIKPILKAKIKVILNHKILPTLFNLRYTPHPQSAFLNIKKVEPGHFITVDSKGLVVKSCYWSLHNINTSQSLNFIDAKNKFYELLEDSIRLRLMGDIPICTLLSGGIDSTVLAAIMNKLQPQSHAYTLELQSDSLNESAIAQKSAQFIGLTHETIRLPQDSIQFFNNVLYSLEEPILDTSIFLTHALSQSINQKYKAILVGEGADEILSGYIHHFTMHYCHLFTKHFSKNNLKRIINILNYFPQSVFEKFFIYPNKLGQSGRNKLIRYLQNIKNPSRSYLSLVGLFDQVSQETIFHPDFSRNSTDNFIEHFFYTDSDSSIEDKLMKFDLSYWTPDYTMLRLDKLMMAKSIECRVPFLDHRLVEFCSQIPHSFKTKFFHQKRILRKSVKGKALIPEQIRQAPKKPFYLPADLCFNHQFIDYAKDTLSSQSFRERGILNMEPIRELTSKKNLDLIDSKRLMAYVTFEKWFKLFIDGDWENHKN